MAGDRDVASLSDMLDAAKLAVRFVEGRSYKDYLFDSMLRSAVERQIEILGEAAGRISKGFKAAHPEIAWQPIITQRHILAHNYDGVQDEKIWRVATIH